MFTVYTIIVHVYNPCMVKNEMDRLTLRPVEVGESLGIGRSKVYELLASGELPSIRVGGVVRVPVDALRAWIARHLEAKQ
jgi:excisionase family DNA binding protein